MINLINKTLSNNLSTTHFCDSFPLIRYMNSEIKPISTQTNMVGTAFTVKCYGDLMPIIEAIDIAPEYSILVIDTNNSPYAVFGEIFTTCAKRKNISGIIIDGMCRDIVEIANMEIPFFAKGVTPRAGTKEKLGNLCESVQCGGITINHGEIILSDKNGIIVLSNEEYTRILPIAISIKDSEDKAINKINKGATIDMILNYKEHKSNINQNKESKLLWI